MSPKIPSLRISFAIVIFMAAAMASSVFIFTVPIHITLLIVIAFAVALLLIDGCSWNSITSAIEDAGKMALPPLFILYVIGAMIGAWIASGTVPLIIYWGLKIIHPSAFLATTAIVAGIVAMATGSSWSTAATVGVALMGVGTGLGIDPAMTAGAIVSGAYLGDKMSPMSDTTNLAPAVAEGDLFDHIKSMCYTTIPGFVIAVAVFAVLGIRSGGNADNETITSILLALDKSFNLSFLTLIPPAIILTCAVTKVPSLITLAIATSVSVLLAIFMQGHSITSIAKIMDTGFVSEIGIAEIDRLLSRGGFQSMNWTCSLAILGIILGTILEKTGVLSVVLGTLYRFTQSVGGLVASTVISVIGLNMLTASQYTSIVIGGRMFITEYKKKNMLPQTLSRTLEDAGTITSPLVPWNTCGVFMAGTLGVSTASYAPYAILCWIVPIIAVMYGFSNKFQWKTGDIPSKKTYPLYEEGAVDQ